MNTDLNALSSTCSISESMARIGTFDDMIERLEAEKMSTFESIASGLAESTDIRYLDTTTKAGAGLVEHRFDRFDMLAMKDGSSLSVSSRDEDHFGLCEVALGNNNDEPTYRLDVDSGIEPIDLASMIALVVQHDPALKTDVDAADNMLWLMHLVLTHIAANA